MSDLKKLIEEWEKAKQHTDLSADYNRLHVSGNLANAERLAAQQYADALVAELETKVGVIIRRNDRIAALEAALNCEECGGSGIHPTKRWDHQFKAYVTDPCTKCSHTRELARGGGR